MTLPLTPEMLQCSYDYLASTPPFNKWNLPDSEDLIFQVAKDKNNHGWTTTKHRKKPKLVISTACVGHTFTLIYTMAHEMVHLYQHLTGMPQNHNAAFDKLKAEVCRYHGFDPKAF